MRVPNLRKHKFKNGWMRKEVILGAEDEYVFYAEKAHPIASDRVRYFNSLIHDKVPYVGYRLLCLLI